MVESSRKGGFHLLSIKHPEADALARQLAHLTGDSITETVLKALREQLKRESGRGQPRDLATDLRQISDECSALPDLDTRTPEEIVGFDEHGIPW